MKNSGLILGATVLSILSAVSSAFAIPSLQLDIKGGTYDSASQTIVSKTGSFTLYAYLIPDAAAPLVGTYYVSAAILPAVSSSTSLGSFKFDGTTVNATSDMTYGTPPVDATAAFDAGDLSTHSVFPTYFKQFGFSFDSGRYSQAYDAQTSTGAGPSTWTSGTKMYYTAFTVDTTGLNSKYGVHFDLYNTESSTAKKTAITDTDVRSFAPFSHDAQSCGATIKCDPLTRVPEPATLTLLGAGLIGLGLFRRATTKS